jgi:F-type H+-transporting ATPase subunit delta
MSTSQIAKRYARALFEAAVEANIQLGNVSKQLRSFDGVLKSSAELQTLLGDGAVPFESKKAVLGAMFTKARTLVAVRNMVYVILEKGRLPLLTPILDELDGLIAVRDARLFATVESATELGPNDTKRIAASLERLTGKKVELESQVNPALLGGVVIRFGNTILDGSLKTQLANLGEQLQNA